MSSWGTKPGGTTNIGSAIKDPQHGFKPQTTDYSNPTTLSNQNDSNANEDAFTPPNHDELEFLSNPNWRQKDGQWIPVVDRAVHSNRERLRRRLEGDGWDFVGGKYGDEEETGSASEESVDEELDVVLILHASETGKQ